MPRINLKATIVMLLFLFAAPGLHAQEQAKTPAQPQAPEENTEKSSSPKQGSALADMIKASQKNKGKMRSIDWDTTKYKEKMTKEREAKEGKTTETPPQENEATETGKNKKVWKHYNDLAQRIKKATDKTQDEEKSEKEIKEKPEAPKSPEEVKREKGEKGKKGEREAENQEQEPAGITDILERYKQSQKQQGPMNSRSYGDID